MQGNPGIEAAIAAARALGFTERKLSGLRAALVKTREPANDIDNVLIAAYRLGVREIEVSNELFRLYCSESPTSDLPKLVVYDSAVTGVYIAIVPGRN